MGRTLSKIRAGTKVKVLHPHVFAGRAGILKMFSKSRFDNDEMPYKVEISGVNGYNIWCGLEHLEVIK